MTSVDPLAAFLTDLRTKADAATPGPREFAGSSQSPIVGPDGQVAGRWNRQRHVTAPNEEVWRPIVLHEAETWEETEWVVPDLEFIASLDPALIRLLCDVVEAAAAVSHNAQPEELEGNGGTIYNILPGAFFPFEDALYHLREYVRGAT